MSKYIVFNCPAYKGHTKDIPDWLDNTNCGKYTGQYPCQDCTDCVIKQVTEKCKTIIEKDYKEEDRYSFSEDGLKILDRIWFDTGMGCKKTARQILQLFDIEEINK